MLLNQESQAHLILGSGHINAQELQQALQNSDRSGFDIDTVKILMNLFDTDRSGTVNIQEFDGIWRCRSLNMRDSVLTPSRHPTMATSVQRI